MMRADFTLTPIGGLGNRIYAICSAITYCIQQNKSLEIIWFKDYGLNCSVKDLFSINPELRNITLRDAKFTDYILNDNPRRRNLWIPSLFQKFIYDRRIYSKEVYDVVSLRKNQDFGKIDNYKRIFMVSYYMFWRTPDMWKSIVINPEIKKHVDEFIVKFKGRKFIGIHIRRTDNKFSTEESPTLLFIEKIREEIEKNQRDVMFYLASDSLEVKKELKNIFGDVIYTSMKETSRNNKQGILDAFIELNILARTNKIYAPSNSSFSELAHFLLGADFEVLKKVKDDNKDI